MREVPQEILEALSGSNSDAVLNCVSLYAGEVVEDTLEVSDWSLSWQLGDQQTIQGSASFTVQDPSGKLAPWGFDEPLSVGGSRIQSTFECAGETMPLGEWLITDNQPNEMWLVTRKGKRTDANWVPGGATVPVTATDLTQLLDNAKFMAPESPPQSGATVFSEIERLCEDIIAVNFVGVSDRSVPKTMVYAEERINVVADLARMVGNYRVNGDGILEIFSTDRPDTPHWKINPGANGALIRVSREQSAGELFNAVVGTSQTEDGEELRAYATLDHGPLRFDGPFGRKPTEMTGTSITQNSLRLETMAYLKNQIEASTTLLHVFCAPNLAYEIGDWGTIVQPVIDGTEYPLVGRCVGVELSGGAGGLADMKLEMECSTADVLAVARYIRSTDS